MIRLRSHCVKIERYEPKPLWIKSYGVILDINLQENRIENQEHKIRVLDEQKQAME